MYYSVTFWNTGKWITCKIYHSNLSNKADIMTQQLIACGLDIRGSYLIQPLF